MPDITIANGSEALLINQTDAEEAEAREHDETQKFVLYTDAKIRIGTGEEQGQLRHAMPVLADERLRHFDPNGREIWAYADGAEATVTVQEQKFTFEE